MLCLLLMQPPFKMHLHTHNPDGISHHRGSLVPRPFYARTARWESLQVEARCVRVKGPGDEANHRGSSSSDGVGGGLLNFHIFDF